MEDINPPYRREWGMQLAIGADSWAQFVGDGQTATTLYRLHFRFRAPDALAADGFKAVLADRADLDVRVALADVEPNIQWSALEPSNSARTVAAVERRQSARADRTTDDLVREPTDRNNNNNPFSVIVCTKPRSISRNIINAWIDELVTLGLVHDCDLIEWGAQS